MSRAFALTAFALMGFSAAPAFAQGAAGLSIEEPSKPGGLQLTLKNGATISLADTRDVVGVQPNGSTLTFGLKFDGIAIYHNRGHEWRNIVGFVQSFTKTPALPEFVKSADSLAVESTYLYFIRSWIGPFARVILSTSVFRGYDVRPGPTPYEIPGRPLQMASRLTLTEPFKPMTLKETVGPFARIATSVPFNLEARIGVGALQTLAKDQLLLADNPDTKDRVEVKVLDDVFQVGGEGTVGVWGTLYDKKITYSAGLGAFIPSTGVRLTNIDIGAAFSIKVVEWATLDYELKAMRQPQLVDAWQIRNGLMLTMGLGYEKKPPKPPEKKKPEPAKGEPDKEKEGAAPAAK